MTERRHCCHIDCKKEAEYVIRWGPCLGDYMESCLEHIPDLLEESAIITITRINQPEGQAS
jgi:hypothetical protein